MGTEYNLHIVATDIEDFKRQIKTAYEALFPAAPAQVAVKKQPKAERPKAEKPKASDTSQKKKKPQKKSGRPRVDNSDLTCSQCGAIKTSQWRRRKAPEGPWCNACHLRDYKARKDAEAGKVPKKKLPRQTRNEKIRKNLKIPKKNKKAPVKEAPITVPKVEIPVDLNGFYTWSKTNVPSEIIRSKAFITGSALIETWYNTIRSNDSFIQWYTENSKEFMAAVRKVFQLFTQRMPTTFIIQDTGDNAVLVATSPTNLTAKKLEPIGNDIENLQEA